MLLQDQEHDTSIHTVVIFPVPKETVGKSSKSKEKGKMAITDCEIVVDAL